MSAAIDHPQLVGNVGQVVALCVRKMAILLSFTFLIAAPMSEVSLAKAMAAQGKLVTLPMLSPTCVAISWSWDELHFLSAAEMALVTCLNY